MYAPRLPSQSRGSYQSRPHTYYERPGTIEREQDDGLDEMFEDLHLSGAPRRDERRVFSHPPPAFENLHNLPRDSRRLSDFYVGESVRPIPGTMASGGASPRVRRRSGQYGPPPVREYSETREPYHHHREEVFVGPRYEPNPMRPRRQTVSDSWEYRRPTVREMPRRVSLRADFDHDQRRESRDVPFVEGEVPISPVRPQVTRNFSRPIIREVCAEQSTRTSQPVKSRGEDAQHTPRRKTFFLSDEEEDEPKQRPRVETPRHASTAPRPHPRAQAPAPETQSRPQAPEPERQPQDPKVGIYINTGHQESHSSASSRSRRPSDKPATSPTGEEKSTSRHRRHRHSSHHAEELREGRHTRGSHEEEPRRERDSRRRSTTTKETRERSSRHHTSDEPSRPKSRRKSSHAAPKERHASCIQQ